MAEFQKVAKELYRLCETTPCHVCPVKLAAHENCNAWIRKYPEKAESIIMQWAKENPLMTNGMKFEEVFGSCAEVVWHYGFDAFSKWVDAEYKEVTG